MSSRLESKNVFSYLGFMFSTKILVSSIISFFDKFMCVNFKLNTSFVSVFVEFR